MLSKISDVRFRPGQSGKLAFADLKVDRTRPRDGGREQRFRLALDVKGVNRQWYTAIFLSKAHALELIAALAECLRSDLPKKTSD
jgi:hypothetical protein